MGGKYRRLLDVCRPRVQCRENKEECLTCRPRVQCGENTEDCLTCVDQGFNVGKIKKNV